MNDCLIYQLRSITYNLWSLEHRGRDNGYTIDILHDFLHSWSWFPGFFIRKDDRLRPKLTCIGQKVKQKSRRFHVLALGLKFCVIQIIESSPNLRALKFRRGTRIRKMTRSLVANNIQTNKSQDNTWIESLSRPAYIGTPTCPNPTPNTFARVVRTNPQDG